MSSSRVQTNLTGVPPVQRLSDVDRLDDIVGSGIGPPAEAAARQQGVDLNLSGLQTGRRRGIALIDGLELIAVPRSRTRRLPSRTTQSSGSMGAWAR